MCLKSEDAHRIELEEIDYQRDKGYFLDHCKPVISVSMTCGDLRFKDIRFGKSFSPPS